MGSFITNLHLRGSDTAGLIAALREERRLPAYVAASAGTGWISAFPSGIDLDINALHACAGGVSRRLETMVLALIESDSDVLWYMLFDKGEYVDAYESAPGFYEGRREPPRLSHPERMLPLAAPGQALEALIMALTQTGPDGKPLSRLEADVRRLRAYYASLKQADPTLPDFEVLEARLRSDSAEHDREHAEFARQLGLSREDALDGADDVLLSADSVLEDLAAWLGLPPDQATASWSYIENGEAPAAGVTLVGA
jgi:hypothetical protein